MILSTFIIDYLTLTYSFISILKGIKIK